MKYQDGEYINLDWDGYTPEGLYVKGHVAPEKFWQAVDQWYGPGEFERGNIRHVFGRWSFCGFDDYGNPARELVTYRESGPGRFKLTESDYTRRPVTA